MDIFTGIEAVVNGYSDDVVIGNGERNYVGLSAGADYADGTGSVDLISYRVNLSDGAIAYTYDESGNQGGFAGVTIDLAAGRAMDHSNSVDTILNFEDADGSKMHDSILDSSGDNQLNGWQGNDPINAGAGNDTIWSDDGDDLLMGGGAGIDLYLMAYATGNVIINDASGNDTVSLNGASGQDIAAADLSGATGIEAIDLAGGGNTPHLTAARVAALTEPNLLRVFGVTGNDSLSGGDGADSLRGGGPNDKLSGGAGDDLYLIGSENDLLLIETSGSDKISVRQRCGNYSGSGCDSPFRD